MNDELVVFRNEIKYQISFAKALSVQSELQRVMSIDQNSKNGKYNIRSLYFDSINDGDYLSKFDGIENRKKIRARIYDGKKDFCKLELKQKFGNNQLKESMAISCDDVIKLCKNEHNTLIRYFETTEIAKKIYKYMVNGAYRPATIIEYDRIAFKYPYGDVRVTIDKNIKARINNLDLFDNKMIMFPLLSDSVILEVKYNGGLPGFISSILTKYNLVEVSYSKYALGRAMFM